MNWEEVVKYFGVCSEDEWNKFKGEVENARWIHRYNLYHRVTRKDVEKKIIKHIQEGNELKKKVKTGSIVKCRGTEKGLGIREVMDVNEKGIIGRKIIKKGNQYFRTEYKFEHAWHKILEILDIKIEKLN